MKLDILAIGVHPDDVELGCSGALLKAIAEGKKVGIIDLTQGELGTRGSIQTRYEEAQNAASLLGVHVRENLKMADGFFKNDEAHQLALISIIRKYQPQIILSNAPEDRHPDHGRSAALVKDAAFLSGLRKIETWHDGVLQLAWRPSYIFNYIQDRYLHPDIIMDITPFFEKKLASILCYTTQFNTTDTSEPQTYISTPEFFDAVKGRALLLGKQIGVKYGEGFLSEKKLGITSFDAFIQLAT